MPRAAIFDVDGTLIDSVRDHAEAWAIAFAAFGHDIPVEALRKQIGKGGDQLMPVFLAPDEVERLGGDIEARRKAVFTERFLPNLRAFPSVRPLFERVRAAGRTIALSSSAKGDELGHYEELAGIRDLVEHRTTSDDAERSKPHPDIFDAALERLGRPSPAEIVVIGDAPYDAEAAGKLDLRTIGLLSGGFTEHELRAAGAIAIFRDPADLLARFDESPLAG